MAQQSPYDFLSPGHAVRCYPTQFDVAQRGEVVRHVNSLVALGAASELRRKMVGLERHSEARLRLVDDFYTALFNANRYGFEARMSGWRLPG